MVREEAGAFNELARVYGASDYGLMCRTNAGNVVRG